MVLTTIISNLVLLRHGIFYYNLGQSLWNSENRFCGWCDVDLTQAGIDEAEFAGKCIAFTKMVFDVVFSSLLKRSIATADVVLNTINQNQVPRFASWRLNERHYGALQGLNKAETAAKYGEDQVKIWRRSYDIPPPQIDENSEFYPGNDPKYNDIPKDEIPVGESLMMTIERVRPYWLSNILPALKEGKNVLVVAHGNTLRAIVKIIEDINNADLLELNIPTGAPLHYKFENERVVEKKYLMPEDLLNQRMEEVANQGKVKK